MKPMATDLLTGGRMINLVKPVAHQVEVAVTPYQGLHPDIIDAIQGLDLGEGEKKRGKPGGGDGFLLFRLYPSSIPSEEGIPCDQSNPMYYRKGKRARYRPRVQVPNRETPLVSIILISLSAAWITTI